MVTWAPVPCNASMRWRQMTAILACTIVTTQSSESLNYSSLIIVQKNSVMFKTNIDLFEFGLLKCLELELDTRSTECLELWASSMKWYNLPFTTYSIDKITVLTSLQKIFLILFALNLTSSISIFILSLLVGFVDTCPAFAIFAHQSHHGSHLWTLPSLAEWKTNILRFICFFLDSRPPLSDFWHFIGGNDIYIYMYIYIYKL